MAREYTCQRDLTDALMDFKARCDREHEQRQTELRRLTGIAEWMEKQVRKNGNPERVRADMPRNDGPTSFAADIGN